MNKLMTNLLNLPSVIVERSLHLEDKLILFVKSKNKTAICPRCGQTSRRLHQNQRYLVKDLPLENKQVVLSVNRRRFKCKKCCKPFSENLDFVCNKKTLTNRYAKSIAQQVLHSDIKKAAHNHSLRAEQVNSMDVVS